MDEIWSLMHAHRFVADSHALCNEHKHTRTIIATVSDLVMQGYRRCIVDVCLGSMYTRAHM